MQKRIFAITGISIKDTGSVSFRFMVDSGAPYEQFMDYSDKFGLLKLDKKGDDYVDPFRLARSEPGAVGDDGIKRWQVFIFKSREGQIFSGSVNETVGLETEEGLARLIPEFPECVLLMAREHWEKFEKACEGLDIKLDCFHVPQELVTA